MPVSAVTTPGAVARRGGHVGSSYRVAASRPPPGWTRARSTRVSRVPSAVVEARPPRSRRVPRGERVGRRENTKTVKKRSLEPSFARPVVLASCPCTRSGGHSYSPCVRDAARRGRRSVPRVGEQRRCCPRTQKPAYFCPSQTKTRSSASRALRRCCRSNCRVSLATTEGARMSGRGLRRASYEKNRITKHASRVPASRVPPRLVRLASHSSSSLDQRE